MPVRRIQYNADRELWRGSRFGRRPWITSTGFIDNMLYM